MCMHLQREIANEKLNIEKNNKLKMQLFYFFEIPADCEELANSRLLSRARLKILTKNNTVS